MRRSTLAILVCIFLGTAVLAGLGSWQVKRLFWKEELIERISARTELTAVPIEEILEAQIPQEDWPYRPVTVEGHFDHEREVYFYATDKKGGAGWNVHTPLVLDNGKTLIVNRGFVPYAFKDVEFRTEGQVAGRQSITGLVRVPVSQKPNSFIPDNALDKREFYWRSLPQMVELMQTDQNREFVDFFVDANDAPVPGGWPKGGTTIISFPNNHLQYAITWYGLALALIGVGTFFLYSRRTGGHD